MRAATSCALAPQGKGRGKALLLAPQTRQTALSTGEGGQRADRVAPRPSGSAPTVLCWSRGKEKQGHERKEGMAPGFRQAAWGQVRLHSCW